MNWTWKKIHLLISCLIPFEACALNMHAIPIRQVHGQSNEARLQADQPEWGQGCGQQKRLGKFSRVTGWLVVELGFVSRLSDSRTMVLNLVCQLKSPRELLSVQMPGHGPVKPELLGVGPR